MSTMPDRLKEIVNVMDFGAKGDEVTDDTAAIQRAYSYASKNWHDRKLYFPSGEYKVDCPLVLGGPKSIFGY